MKLKTLGLGAAMVVLATVGLGAATATASGEYDWYDGKYYPRAYSYIYYSDAEKTQVLGTAYDTCIVSYDPTYAAHVSNPYIPTAYYDESFMHHCGGMGPVILP